MNNFSSSFVCNVYLTFSKATAVDQFGTVTVYRFCVKLLGASFLIRYYMQSRSCRSESRWISLCFDSASKECYRRLARHSIDIALYLRVNECNI